MQVAGCVCPHPPLLIPEIGKEHREMVRATVEAMNVLAQAVGEPETIVIISPHTPGAANTFTVKSPPRLWGDFSAFRCPEVGLEIDNDLDIVTALLEVSAGESGLRLEPVDDDYLDHGVLVPMSFLKAKRLVSLSIVADYAIHRRLGELVRAAVTKAGRDSVVFVASGDLSHRLTRDAPAGFDPQGAVYDAKVTDHLSRGEFSALLELDEGLINHAGECGLRSFIALGGYLGDHATDRARLLSYQGPFGVGYAVASYGLDLP